MIARTRVAREAWLSLTASTALAGVVHHTSLIHPASTVPGDLGDPLLETWQLAWDGHALVHQSTNVFGANAFFPNSDSLAFSDSLLGYGPLSILGSGPSAALIRYNLIFVAVAALAVWGPYLLARQLGARPPGAMVAGLICGYAPWRLSQLGHLHILSTGTIALALALLARGHGYPGKDPHPRLAFAGWAMAAWQITVGFGLGLAFLMLLGALSAATLARWLRSGRPAVPQALLVADAVGVGLLLLVVALFARPYLDAVSQHPEARRTVADVASFSPPWRGLFIAPASSWFWGGLQTGTRKGLRWPPEMCLLPGVTALALATFALASDAISRRHKIILGASAATLAIFALGTQGPFGGRFTYLVLFHNVPGWQGVRTPSRLVALLLLPVALLAAKAVDELTSGGRRWLALPVAALVLAEGLGTVPHPVAPHRPAGLDALNLPGAQPALVLPSDEIGDMTVMFWSSDGFPRMVNGGSGFTPWNTAAIRSSARTFPDVSAVTALRSTGVRTVAVLLDRLDADAAMALRQAALPAGVTRSESGGVLLFGLGESGS